MNSETWEFFLTNLIRKGTAIDVLAVQAKQFEERFGTKPSIITFNIKYRGALVRAMLQELGDPHLQDNVAIGFPLLLDGVVVTPDADLGPTIIMRCYHRELAKTQVLEE